MEHHPEGVLMESDTYNALMKTIQRDCRVLESFKIMDYSLLLAIHNLDQAQKEKLVISHANCQKTCLTTNKYRKRNLKLIFNMYQKMGMWAVLVD